jgi:hypothetical protein
VKLTDRTIHDFFLTSAASSSAAGNEDKVASVLTTSVDSDSR